MKWVKRILVLCFLLALVLGALAMVARHLSKTRPDWYPSGAPDPVAIDQARRSLQNKVLAVQTWAAETQARENKKKSGREPVPTDSPNDPPPNWTLTLSEAELNGFFSQWDSDLHLSDKYSKFISDPVLVIRDERLILAGTVKDLDTLVSIHFEPKLDENGMLRLDLARVMGGKLPLPQAIWSGYRDKLSGALDRKVESERQGAKIAPDGTSNREAVGAAMNSLLVHAIRGEPADPILFLPHDLEKLSKTAFPVRVTGVKVGDKTLTLTVQGLTPAERVTLLQKIREPSGKTDGKSPSLAASPQAAGAVQVE